MTNYIKHLQSVTPHHFDFSSLSVLEYAALIINAKSLLRSEGVGSLARLFQKLVGRALADRTEKAARTAAHEHPRKGFFASISRAFTRSHVSS